MSSECFTNQDDVLVQPDTFTCKGTDNRDSPQRGFIPGVRANKLYPIGNRFPIPPPVKAWGFLGG